jgi:ribbon-helix-helix protein
MEDSDNVRWTISVPKQTDVALRTFLAQAGLKKGNLSEFVADAVRWRLFDLNVSAARAKNAGVPSEEIEDAIEEALTHVRAERFRKPL